MKNKKHLIHTTLNLRVKDKYAQKFLQMASEVNMVWNYVRAMEYTSRHPCKRTRFKEMSAFDVHPFTTGTKGLLNLPASSIQSISTEYITRRKQFEKDRLKARYSKGSKKKLGWIPFKQDAIRIKNGILYFQKQEIKVWDSYGLSDYGQPVVGSFNEDSQGRWFVNLTFKIEKQPHSGTGSVGIDLGISTPATTSNNEKLKGGWYKKLESKIRKAQRANKTKQVKKIHQKVKNKRKDDMHKFSTKLVKDNFAIFVGNVLSKAIIKKGKAKGTYDASWYQLKEMLRYKSHKAGIFFEEIDESYTTQTCSACGSIPAASPKGETGLRIREWTCGECGTIHDRDVNAALNILARGHASLAGGIPVL